MTSSAIHTVSLIRYVTVWDCYVLAMEILVLGFTFFYTFEEFQEFTYLKLKYFTKFWTYIDVIVLIVSRVSNCKLHRVSEKHLQLLYSCTILNLMAATSRGQIKKLLAVENAHANYEHIVGTHITYRNFSAVLAFFVFIKLFKYLSFNKTMGQLNSTIKNVSYNVVCTQHQ